MTSMYRMLMVIQRFILRVNKAMRPLLVSFSNQRILKRTVSPTKTTKAKRELYSGFFLCRDYWIIHGGINPQSDEFLFHFYPRARTARGSRNWKFWLCKDLVNFSLTLQRFSQFFPWLCKDLVILLNVSLTLQRFSQLNQCFLHFAILYSFQRQKLQSWNFDSMWLDH